MNVFDFFRKLGGLIGKAIGFARDRGLDDELMKVAGELVRRAAGMTGATNADRREWVVQGLVGMGIPESLARLGTELAVQAWKRESAKRQPAQG